MRRPRRREEDPAGEASFAPVRALQPAPWPGRARGRPQDRPGQPACADFQKGDMALRRSMMGGSFSMT